MAGEIKHKWHGTVLTITSDSGTSSADLRGRPGDDGIRGPQGRPGVILNNDGTVDFNAYATEDYVDQRIDELEFDVPEVDLSNYYTKAEIDATLAEFQPSGGGGGGGGNNAVMTLQNTTGWLQTAVAQGSPCVISGYWDSTENGMSTGLGAMTLMVNGVIKYTANVPQGAFSLNVAPYLATGTNSVRLSIADAYGNSRSVIFTIEVVALTITSTFDSAIAYTGGISFPYVANGNVEKTVHFILDDKELGTATVTTSGRQRTYNIPAQSHGSHRLEVYFTAKVNGLDVESNRLIFDVICLEAGKTTPIISCISKNLTAAQFETIKINYSVYTPDALTSNVELLVNGASVSTLVVDRTQQLWTYVIENPGTNTLVIKCGSVSKVITVQVDEVEMDVAPATDGLELYLTSSGRSNSEANPGVWSFNDIECQFSNYNWASDGWIADENNLIVHRLSGDARLTIPFKMFENDVRSTGKTIEFEFATRDTLDYEAVIASCMSGGVGFELTPQQAVIKSEQSAITVPYKENEHIRLTFVIEKRAENRLIYTYLDGVMCGAVQYADNDNFSQGIPVNFTLGSNLATLDIYTIRVYANSLTRYEVLDNWIADTREIEEKFARYNRNRVYDAYGNIIIGNLPSNLPYMILEAEALPDYVGNIVEVKAQYVDPLNPGKSFTQTGSADVQGTSSAGYVRKNYIITYPENYQLRENSIPTNMFTYKADVASSEGANNVELVRLYNNISPYKTPPQLEDERVRQGIDGFPIVIFHNDGAETKFIGKYNFNNDKGTPEVFGFAPGDESWEIRNNTSNRVLFKSADFSGEDWLKDFKARYPAGNASSEKLAAFASWVVSTDTTGLSEAERAARLQKFKTELPDYAEVDSALFYYLFTELFLMVDSRAKNAFPTFYNGNKVCWLPYDMDTAMGINNEGALAFGYELEDIDTIASGADVYNGQQSVFWCNLRDTYGEELKEMYQTLRSDGVLSYEIVEQMFDEHQSVWPEAIWNEDAWYKYLQPLVESNNASYLTMLQGNKASQRKWWLYNRFRYLDSKYNAGDANTDFITLRGYEKSNISIEPYADIYATILYGSYLVQERALRGDSYELECPMDTLNDTEIYIYSASQIKDVGDLSGLKVGYADFTDAIRLQFLRLGSSASGYSNSNLKELYLGNNTLLNTLDVRNCPALEQSVDLSGCSNIEHVYFDGTAIKGCSLPNGGILKTLHLPSTITNLTIINQKSLTDLSIPSYANITTLRLENAGSRIDMLSILNQIAANSRVRLIGIDWTANSYSEIETFYNRLDTMRGLDENDNNMDKAQVSGTIHVASLTTEQLNSLRSKYPSIEIVCGQVTAQLTYVDYDGTVLYTTTAAVGSLVPDPVAKGLIPTPTRATTAQYTYSYIGWDAPAKVENNNMTITAQYRVTHRTYAVSFYNSGTLLYTTQVPYGQAVNYSGSTPVAPAGSENTLFAGWYPQPGVVTGDCSCNALFASDDITEEEITDSWETIIASVKNGTYADKYHRGQYKVVDIKLPSTGNSTSVIEKVYIMAFAVDLKADGNPAPITWVVDAINMGKCCWDKDNKYMEWPFNDVQESVVAGFNQYFPAIVRNNLVAVQKECLIRDSQYDINTVEVWPLDLTEWSTGKVYLNGTVIGTYYEKGPNGGSGRWLRDYRYLFKYDSALEYNYTAQVADDYVTTSQYSYGYFGFCT